MATVELRVRVRVRVRLRVRLSHSNPSPSPSPSPSPNQGARLTNYDKEVRQRKWYLQVMHQTEAEP